MVLVEILLSVVMMKKVEVQMASPVSLDISYMFAKL